MARVNLWILNKVLSGSRISDPYTGKEIEPKKKEKGDKRNISPTLWNKDFADISKILKGLGYHCSTGDNGEWPFEHEYDNSYFVVSTGNCSISVRAFIINYEPGQDHGTEFAREASSDMVFECKWTRFVLQEKPGRRGPPWVKRSHFPRPKWRKCIVQYMMPHVKKGVNARLLEMVIDS